MTTSIDTTVTIERLAAEDGWKILRATTGFRARLEAWQRTDSDLGPLLSARVTGLDAVRAVRWMAAGSAVGADASSLQAVLDYSVPGRVACVWQSNGVWVELWHPDPLEAVQEPPAAAARPARRRALLRGPSGRLPFTRRSKETTTS